MDPADTKAPPVASFSINRFGARVILIVLVITRAYLVLKVILKLVVYHITNKNITYSLGIWFKRMISFVAQCCTILI